MTDNKELNNIELSNQSKNDTEKRKFLRKKGVALHSKERDVIKSIIEICDLEAREKSLIFPVKQATKRAAHYAKVSERTIKRLRDEMKLNSEISDFKILKKLVNTLKKYS